ncbi:MAG: mechanosensitive ion channel domain-containing protein [Flavobacteriales bacterium]|jgi:small-conductance mechanosensitive channel
MKPYEIKIIETAIVLISVLISLKIVQRVIDRFGKKYSYHKTRIKIVRKIILFIALTLLTVIIAFIWGIKASQLATYIASLFTVLGIAFVAQWSLLSNITATLIIFFNHQVNIGDTIQILDKEFLIEGEISDVGIFFTVIKTKEGEYISLPSNVFIQKMVKKIKK